jgi:predicted TIM-barrel fold metal-dependent hydrolase
MNGFTRRELMMMSVAGAALAQKPTRPPGVIVDTHIHLFGDDLTRFPPSSIAPYKIVPATAEKYSEFAREARIDHTIMVSPEPYQDDHRYLEYCFEHEPSHGFFKGTCLFDPIAPETPARMEALVKRNPGRIAALRVHEYNRYKQERRVPPATTGPICDRDMESPAMLATWRKAHSLGLAVQMHFTPCYAKQIGAVASQAKEITVLLDHEGRAGQGTPMDYEEVLRLADLPHVYLKFSNFSYASKERYPYRDAQPMIRRFVQVFGADRILWGGLGHSMPEFERAVAVFEEMLAFASESDRAKIRGLNAMRLFNF